MQERDEPGAEWWVLRAKTIPVYRDYQGAIFRSAASTFSCFTMSCRLILAGDFDLYCVECLLTYMCSSK